MAFTAERDVRIGFSILFLVLCVIGAISYYSVTRLREDADSISHTHEGIAAVHSIASGVANAVSAERGFALTGDKAYLDQHDAAARAVQGGLERLALLVADNPAQLERLKNVDRLVTERMAFVRGVNELYRSEGIDAVRAMLAQGAGRGLSERIAAAIDEFEAAERALLSERSALAARVTTRTKAVILAGAALALVALTLALYLFSRDFAGRRRAEAALHAAMNELETRVRDRTAELAHANKAVLDSEERLRGVIQSAMDAIITVDEKQNVMLFNATAERIFGCPAAEAIGGALDRFIPARFREAHRGHIRRFGSTGVTTRMMGARLDLFGLRASGEEFPIDASISQVAVDGEKFYTVILRDVSERRRFEAKIQEERDSAQQYLDVAGVMLLALDGAGKVTLINRKGRELLGYQEEEIVGQSWFDRFVPELHREETRKVFAELMAGETKLRAVHENPVVVRGGAERLIEWRNQLLTDHSGAAMGTLSSGEDITEHRNAQEALERSYSELRELSRVMNEVREAERTRVARELHDELAQWLTALKMDIAWLSARLPAGEGSVLDRTDRMKKVVDTTVASVRRIAADLRPMMLDDLGLVPSIENLVQALAERANFAVKLEVSTDGFDFRDPLATSVYRMVQEALTNVARHARATEVRVTLAREGDALLLRVADNGVGLGPPAPGRKSYGTLGIRERAQTLGGEARIYSPAEGGTVVEIRIPLARFSGAEAPA